MPIVEPRFAFILTHRFVGQKHIKLTSNTLDSHSTITTVVGFVTFLWQVVVYQRHSQNTANARVFHWITCIPLVCQSEIIAVAQILYTIMYIFIQDIPLKFVLTCFNTAFGSSGYFNLPIARSQRQVILKHTVACTYSLVLGLALLYSLPRSTVVSTECRHSSVRGMTDSLE